MRSLIPTSAVAFALLAPLGASADTVSLQDVMNSAPPLPQATIFVANEFITMDPKKPRAEAVATVGGKIVAVGSRAELERLAGNQDYRIDETFKGKVVTAGFIDQHVHPFLAALTMITTSVISIEDWDTVTGFSAAVRDPETYQTRLKEALDSFDKSKGETFTSWGYHHYMHGELSRQVLDKLAPDFPVAIWHRSAHEFFLNTKALEKYQIDKVWFDTFTASQKAQSNFDKGHFFEQGAIKLLERLAPAFATPEKFRAGLEYSEQYYHQNGITTAAEPGGFALKSMQEAINSVYGDDATPFNHYFIPDGKTFAAKHLKDGPEVMIGETRKVLDWGQGRSRWLPQQIKFLTDGAIFSQLMMMKDGYTDGHEGAWIMDPDVFSGAFQVFWDAGYQIHVHNNGDAGMDVLVANLERAMRRNPRFDHRMTVVHFGFARAEQVDRLKALGAIVSANPYYVTALAGFYAKVGIGPERAPNMVPMGDVMRNGGMSISFHSDMPMAPAKPLQLMWSGVNRITAEGSVSGPQHKVDVETALKAITINAAYSIRLENEIGSIEPGKLANFTVLEQSPFDVEPARLKDIKVWGTVLEGRVQPVPAASGGAKKASLAPVTPPEFAALDNGTLAGELPAFTSSQYLLRASRIANDQGLCGDHNIIVQAMFSGLKGPFWNGRIIGEDSGGLLRQSR
jgi:predicted amidohydrolase YtcJ